MPFYYLKPSFRILMKMKVITSINILGLSIGISAALIIYLIVQYDYSFDRYEPDGALKDPYQLVLTESLAKTYFPGIPVQQVVGRTLMIVGSYCLRHRRALCLVGHPSMVAEFCVPY
jgi:hypothetical protein